MGRKPTTVRYFRRTKGLGEAYFRTEPGCLCLSICHVISGSKWATSSRRACDADAHIKAGLLVEISAEECPVRNNEIASFSPTNTGFPLETFIG